MTKKTVKSITICVTAFYENVKILFAIKNNIYV